MKFSEIFSSKGKRNKAANLILRELDRINSLPADQGGVAQVFDKPFRFHHASSFIHTHRRLFQDGMYMFSPQQNKGGVILDGGANMGLSVLYFSQHYPDHHIIAFEPEKSVFDILEENVRTFGLKNVELYQKALWTEKKELLFHSDGGMGGRVNNLYFNIDRPIQKVEAVPLVDFLDSHVDFLKLDIEGAEEEVLMSCRGKLSQVRHLFFEYHNHLKKPQSLHRLLSLVEEEGFRYYIKESSFRSRPFLDESLFCECFDMAITVFCYK
ncbi:FkbM family methyltransferase [Pleomorphovibrio marinus]|uniref:FkbM family methyltransferase n=1 Tax=Pleomorphovibrio marinus TaxID=2164132 RepID=UPI000E0CA33D|nr:FkbM family methyltransferase [Pleomorphovibrio marinus]